MRSTSCPENVITGVTARNAKRQSTFYCRESRQICQIGKEDENALRWNDIADSMRREDAQHIEKAGQEVCRAAIGDNDRTREPLAADEVALGRGEVRKFTARGRTIYLVAHDGGRIFGICDAPEHDLTALKCIRAERDGDLRAVGEQTAAIAGVSGGAHFAIGEITDIFFDCGDEGVLSLYEVEP